MKEAYLEEALLKEFGNKMPGDPLGFTGGLITEYSLSRKRGDAWLEAILHRTEYEIPPHILANLQRVAVACRAGLIQYTRSLIPGLSSRLQLSPPSDGQSPD